MNIKKSVLAMLLVVAVLMGGVGVIALSALGITDAHIITKTEYSDYQYLAQTYNKLDGIKRFLKENYYIDVDEKTLLEGTYYGIVDALGDPYSEYVSADNYADYFGTMLGEYYGVGMSFYNNPNGVLEVVQVYRNSPAAAANMKPGDIITRVDGVPFSGAESTEAAASIRGKDGTTVEITYIRDGVESVIKLTRAKIQVETVSGKMLEGNVGYIAIDSFEAATAADFRNTLEDLTAKGAKKLVIDLRNNGGGLVDSAVEIADMLMDKGTVVYTENILKEKQYYTTSAGRTALPYAVLVNEYSASATEILAAGIKDNKEGIIVGTTTFGKGIIQSLYPLNDGSAVKITVMQYYSPSGSKIHKVGITPDYEVSLVSGDNTDYQLEKALEVLK